MKKLDQLLVRGFFPPFILTFFVAMFVLNMQFLWKYIDEIVGKGLEVRVIFELLFYQSLAMVPLAMLLGMLIASVMTLGNLAEKFELVTMKSAGVSLYRTLQPLFIISVCLAVVSFVFSDRVIPVATLKFKSRLYDIRRLKPALAIETGQFNYDFQDFVIYIKSKSKDDQQIYGIKIFDHTQHRGNVSQVNADSGQMFYSLDKRYLIMKLKGGERYEEMREGQGRSQKSRSSLFPFLRMKFKDYTVLFDMKQFNLDRTDEELFKNHYSLLSIRQLFYSIDSLENRVGESYSRNQENSDPMFFYSRRTTNGVAPEGRKNVRRYAPDLPANGGDEFFYDKFSAEDKKRIARSAVNIVSGLQNLTSSSVGDAKIFREELAKHYNEVHRKFVLAFMVIVFLFIGGSMGAIIRKGGFGWPILIAIIYFVLYFIMSLIGEKTAQNMAIPSWLGMWGPAMILSPLAAFLTYKSTNDSNIFDVSKLTAFAQSTFERVRNFRTNRKSETPQPVVVPAPVVESVAVAPVTVAAHRPNKLVTFIRSVYTYIFESIRGLVAENRIFFGALLLYVLGLGYVIWEYDAVESHLLSNKLHRVWLHAFYRNITNFSGPLTYTALAIGLCIFGSYRKALAVILSGVSVFVLSFALKSYFLHPRPCAVFRERGAFWMLDLVPDTELICNAENSFPSGHTFSAFVLFGIVAFTHRHWLFKLACTFMAINIAFSRVYLNQHFVKDIWAGALAGTALAIVVYLIVHAFEKPSLDKRLLDWRKRV